MSFQIIFGWTIPLRYFNGLDSSDLICPHEILSDYQFKNSSLYTLFETEKLIILDKATYYFELSICMLSKRKFFSGMWMCTILGLFKAVSHDNFNGAELSN